MRFRRRHQKNRHQVHASLALDPADQDAAVDAEERSALLAHNQTDRAQQSSDSRHSSSGPDPGQDLLGALGDFHQQLAAGRELDTGGNWRDVTMGHLVTGYRVAKKQGWNEIAQALADTGRILQTYVDGGVAKDALPILQRSYQALSLMVGDQIAGQMSPAVREQWQQHYQEALMAIKAAGLSLAQDSDNAQKRTQEKKPAQTPPKSQQTDTSETPFAEPAADTVQGWNDEEELPVLEELPPLESLIEAGIEPAGDTNASAESTTESENATGERTFEAPENASLGKHGEALADWVEQETHEDESGPAMGNMRFLDSDEDDAAEPSKPPAPPKIIVDILDRLCDQLRIIERTTGDERTLHLERLAGAISVLQREAEKHHFEHALPICGAMEDLCGLALETEGPLNDRFLELGYAFGGVFMDAVQDGETKSVGNWRIECDLLMENWDSKSTDSQVAPSAKPEPKTASEAAAADPAKTDMDQAGESQLTLDQKEESQPELRALDRESQPQQPKPEPEAQTTADQPAEAEPSRSEKPAAPAPAVAEPGDDCTSQELLEYAQKAATTGDGTGAKFLALRAAAQFAREETERAEQFLAVTEAKLRKSMESTEAAREQVKVAEEGVLKSATGVAEGETALGTMQERRGKIAQHLEELHNNVARIEEEIRALQAKMEQEIQKSHETSGQLERAKEEEQNAEAQLEQLRRAEEEARLNLEKCRQEVKDHQRATLEIEAEMHHARDLLTQQRSSLVDIRQTIDQISGSGHKVEKPDAMLF